MIILFHTPYAFWMSIVNFSCSSAMTWELYQFEKIGLLSSVLRNTGGHHSGEDVLNGLQDHQIPINGGHSLAEASRSHGFI